ncbi:MAG TPA: MFS transporter [Polyangiaceae bacterium]|nr:MFS transporter [Polyangiaceae bacterium]
MSAPAESVRIFSIATFRRWALFRLASILGSQVQLLAVGWYVYGLTGRPMSLAYVGLAQFLPVVSLVLVTGHVADRFDRRAVLAVCSLVQASAALAFAALSYGGSRRLGAAYALCVVTGVVRAFWGPASQSLVPSLVPAAALPRALAFSSSLWQFATIAGPSLGGLLLAAPTGVPGGFGAAALLMLAAGALAATLRPRQAPPKAGAASWSTLLAGVRYVREQRLLLACVSLDLFAVLLGGATALLPVYARDVLHVGARGLGLLRAAPSAGALAMAAWLAFRPLGRRAGVKMLASVFAFGLLTIAFGVSTNVYASLGALALLGAADMVSVVVRQTLVQLRTPDAMRGRVSAVNQVFIGASNELGEFESGATAALFGAVPAVVLGGVGTCLVVALWAWLFPELRRVDRLDHPPPP